MFLQDCTLIGKGETKEKLQLNLKFGEVRVNRTSKTTIKGELYNVSDKKIETFDIMEGIGSGGGKRKSSGENSDSESDVETYKVVRKEITATTEDGAELKAFIFISSIESSSGWEPILSGDVSTAISPDGDSPNNDDEEEDEEDEEDDHVNYKDSPADANLPASVSGVAGVLEMMKSVE